MHKWKPLFEEMIKQIDHDMWDIGDVVETLKVWISIADTEDSNLAELEQTYLKYQVAEDGMDEQEDFMRVCSKLFHA